MSKNNSNMRDLGFRERWPIGSIEARLVEKVTTMGLRFVCLSPPHSNGEYVFECKEANLMYHSKNTQ